MGEFEVSSTTPEALNAKTRRITQIDQQLENCPLKVERYLLEERRLRAENEGIRQKKNGMGGRKTVKEKGLKSASLMVKQQEYDYDKIRMGEEELGYVIRKATLKFRNEDGFVERFRHSCNVIADYCSARAKMDSAQEEYTAIKRELLSCNQAFAKREARADELQQQVEDMLLDAQYAGGGLTRSSSNESLTDGQEQFQAQVNAEIHTVMSARRGRETGGD